VCGGLVSAPPSHRCRHGASLSVLRVCGALSSLRKSVSRLVKAIEPYTTEHSGLSVRQCEQLAPPTPIRCVLRLWVRSDRASGMGMLSHKKKPTFWHNLCETFPHIIDFLTQPQNAAQVRHSSSVGAALVRTAHRPRAVLCGVCGHRRRLVYNADPSRSTPRLHCRRSFSKGSTGALAALGRPAPLRSLLHAWPRPPRCCMHGRAGRNG
jgi:hypothetical protein